MLYGFIIVEFYFAKIQYFFKNTKYIYKENNFIYKICILIANLKYKTDIMS